MPEPLRPAPAKAYGRENWVFVPTIAGYAAGTGPTAAEITGASALDITKIAFADGAPAPTQNTNLVEQQRRLGDEAIYQFVGTTTYGGGQMNYAFDPQAAAGSNGKKAWELFKNTTGPVTGYLVRRLNVARATNFAAGQFVDVYPVEIGPSMPGKAGDGESAEVSAMSNFAITAPPIFNVAVA